MTREQAEQRLKRPSDGVFLLQASSQAACYARSLKNQDHEIVYVVVGTSFAEQPHGDGRAKKIAFWINVGGVQTAFESIDAVAAELGSATAGDARHVGVEFHKELVCK
jgi:hypothetical protein